MPRAAKRNAPRAKVSTDRILIQRTAPKRDEEKRFQSNFQSHVSKTLDQSLTELEKQRSVVDRLRNAPTTVRQDPKRKLKDEAILKYGAEQASLVNTLFDFTINGGSQIIAPPYDREFENDDKRENFSWYRNTGEWTMMSIDSVPAGSSGVGIFISSSKRSLAAITPIGSYSFSILAADAAPNLSIRGGLGLTVFSPGVATPDQNRMVTLWNIHGFGMLQGQSGSGRIADAASPAFGLGPVRLAPLFVDMQPDVRYLVWVWSWYVRSGPGSHFAAMSVKVPLITVDAGPPLNIH